MNRYSFKEMFCMWRVPRGIRLRRVCSSGSRGRLAFPDPARKINLFYV